MPRRKKTNFLRGLEAKRLIVSMKVPQAPSEQCTSSVSSSNVPASDVSSTCSQAVVTNLIATTSMVTSEKGVSSRDLSVLGVYQPIDLSTTPPTPVQAENESGI